MQFSRKKNSMKKHEIINKLHNLLRYEMEVQEFRKTRFRDSHSEVKEVHNIHGPWVKWDDIKDLLDEMSD